MRNAIALILLLLAAPDMSYTVTLAYDGTGTGTTVLSPLGPYTAGTVVTPIATSNSGSVFVAYDQPWPFTVNGDMTLTTTFNTCPCDCVKSKYEGGNAQHYADWVGYGKWNKPDCWCYKYQCRGDADGLKVGMYRVQANDFNIFISAFNKGDLKLDQTKICADFDHKKVGMYRVQADDLSELTKYFNKSELKRPVCPLDWDGDGDDDYNFWITP